MSGVSFHPSLEQTSPPPHSSSCSKAHFCSEALATRGQAERSELASQEEFSFSEPSLTTSINICGLSARYICTTHRVLQGLFRARETLHEPLAHGLNGNTMHGNGNAVNKSTRSNELEGLGTDAFLEEGGLVVWLSTS